MKIYKTAGIIAFAMILSHFAWAKEDGVNLNDVSAQPYELARISYQSTLFLDAKIFDVHRLKKLGWMERTEKAAHVFGIQLKQEFARTNEGIVINIKAKGRAIDVERFFDTAIKSVMAVTGNNEGWVWGQPSDEYRAWWSANSAGTLRDIRSQAFMQCSAA